MDPAWLSRNITKISRRIHQETSSLHETCPVWFLCCSFQTKSLPVTLRFWVLGLSLPQNCHLFPSLVDSRWALDLDDDARSSYPCFIFPKRAGTLSSALVSWGNIIPSKALLGSRWPVLELRGGTSPASSSCALNTRASCCCRHLWGRSFSL